MTRKIIQLRWPIRNQIFLPVATLLLVAIASIAVLLAAVAAQQSSREQMERVEHVVATLDEASFPLSENVLTKMRRTLRHRVRHSRRSRGDPDLDARLLGAR